MRLFEFIYKDDNIFGDFGPEDVYNPELSNMINNERKRYKKLDPNSTSVFLKPAPQKDKFTVVPKSYEEGSPGYRSLQDVKVRAGIIDKQK